MTMDGSSSLVFNRNGSYTITFEGDPGPAELDRTLQLFNSTVGVEVSSSNTPLAYSYIESAVNYLTNNGESSNIAKMWMIANVLSELTPQTSKASNYFSIAAHNDGSSIQGNVYDINSSTIGEFETRNRSAILYSKFKHDNLYTASNNARNELYGKGVSDAVIRTESFYGISDSEVVHAAVVNVSSDKHNTLSSSLPRVLPIDHPTNSSSGYDYIETNNIKNSYPNVASVKDYNGEINGYQPMKDKYHSPEYFARIMGLSSSAYDLLTDISKYTSKESERLKYAYWRKRPNVIFDSQTTCPVVPKNAEGVYGIYLSDDTIYPYEFTPKTLEDDLKSYAIGNKDDAKYSLTPCQYSGPYTSFPSGHSTLAFLSLLGCIEKFGDSGNKEQRMIQYCDNRAVVRAHWKTDVLIGELISGMQIGFLNGFKSFNDLIV
jgi:hypothetical protein